MDKLVPLYMDNIVRLHGTPVFIISDGDVIFIARVWKEVLEVMGTELKFSTTFHLHRHMDI